jgi:hypothetical protein
MSRDGFCSKILAGPMVMVAVFANLSIASLAHSTELSGGFLGRPLVEVEQQSFFKGFRLAEFAKRKTPYNARVVIFKPAQTPIHFEVAATIDKNENVLAIQLWLRRSFIEESGGGTVARDLVQRFFERSSAH